MYTPDRWVVLKLEKDNKTFYKVFAGWMGGYLSGDSWRINSGITKVELDNDHYLFHGHSGSVYKCHKNAYGMTSYMATIASANDVNVVENIDFTTLFISGEEK